MAWVKITGVFSFPAYYIFNLEYQEEAGGNGPLHLFLFRNLLVGVVSRKNFM